jgi:hypothetical protein
MQSMKLNIDHNVGKVIRPSNSDARGYMYSLLIPQKASGDMPFVGKFDVIDLNSHGTAVCPIIN